jgi:hypothetical protein
LGILAETSTVYSANNEETDDDGLPTIEELLQTTLRKEGFGVGGPDTEHAISAVGKVDSERGSSVDHSTSAFSGSSGGNLGEHA